MAPGILARVPKELDALNQEVVITASIGLGFTIAHPPGHRVFSIELGSGATVDGLPGVPAGSGYVGTFDREEAVENEFIDFFASGHPLVEGIFAHYEESALGRAVRFEIKMGTEIDAGLVAIYKDGRAFEVVAIDVAGNARPDWAAAVLRRPIIVRPVTRRGREGSGVAEHGAPAGGAARPDASPACGRGDRGSAGCRRSADEERFALFSACFLRLSRSICYSKMFSTSGNNSVVECDLAKVEVAGSNPVSRSNLRSGSMRRLSTIARSELRRATVDLPDEPELRLASQPRAAIDRDDTAIESFG